MAMTRARGGTVVASDAERWISLVGGGLLAIYGLTRREPSGALLALMGGGLAYRGVTGRARLHEGLEIRRVDAGEDAAIDDDGRTVEVERIATVRRPIEPVFRGWRKLESVPRFMDHIESVLPLGGNRFRWTMQAPLGTVEWIAEILDERENRSIDWRSVPGSPLASEGGVRFEGAPGGNETRIHMRLVYQLPPGRTGRWIKKLLVGSSGSALEDSRSAIDPIERRIPLDIR
jgi:uncharacterized membrane protein